MSAANREYRFNSSALALLGAKAAYAGLSFAQFAVLVRYLNRDAVNTLAVALAVQNLMAIAADFGVSYVAAKRGAGVGSRLSSSVLAAGTVTLAASNILAWVVAAVMIAVLFEDAAVMHAAVLGALLGSQRSLIELTDSNMTARGRAEWVAWQSFVQYGLSLAGAWVIAAFSDGGTTWILVWNLMAGMLSLVLRALTMKLDIAGLMDAAEVRREVREFVRASPAFGMHALIIALSSANIYTLIVSQIPYALLYLADFQGAQKIGALAGLAGGVVARAFYVAVCHAATVNDRPLLARYLDQASRVLAILAAVVTIPCLVLPEHITKFLYGDRLPESAALLWILGIGLPFSFIGYIPSNLLAARGHHWLRLLISFGFGVLACPVAWFCTTRWGIMGAAGALSGMTAASAVAFYIAERVVLGNSVPFQSIWRIGAAAVASAICGLAVRDYGHVLATVGSAEVIFVLVLVAIDATHRRQCLTMWRRLVSRGAMA